MSGQVRLWIAYLMKAKPDKAQKSMDAVCYALRQAAAVIESADFVTRHPVFNADGSKTLQLRQHALSLLLVDKDKKGSEYFQLAVKAATRASWQYAAVTPPPPL